jgi:hypothetical protein
VVEALSVAIAMTEPTAGATAADGVRALLVHRSVADRLSARA